jgi:hypothetical protein
VKLVFVDTGAWIAINNKRDNYHRVALKTNKELLENRYFYVTSDFVLDEAYTFLRYDIGHKKTVEFGENIQNLREKRKIEVVHVSEELQQKAWDLFVQYSDRDFSFTDCTSFVAMWGRGINQAFTFDKHFIQIGFIVFPDIS